jgi:hypothetical protein
MIGVDQTSNAVFGHSRLVFDTVRGWMDGWMDMDGWMNG